MHLARRCSTAFASAVAFPDDGGAIGLNGDAHPGDIDRDVSPTVFSGEYAFGFDGLSAPAIEAKDPVGLRDRIPALDIGELAAMGLACANTTVIEIVPQRRVCLAEKPITVSSHSKPVPVQRAQRRRFPHPV